MVAEKPVWDCLLVRSAQHPFRLRCHPTRNAGTRGSAKGYESVWTCFEFGGTDHDRVSTVKNLDMLLLTDTGTTEQHPRTARPASQRTRRVGRNE